jgi:hypothetical protein
MLGALERKVYAMRKCSKEKEGDGDSHGTKSISSL